MNTTGAAASSSTARGKPSGARSWYDLPMAAAMWSADGREVRG